MYKFHLILLAILLFVTAGMSQSRKGSGVLGSWEGESKCMVPSSPCHDEHVLYQISVDKKDPEQLSVDGYKIVDGNLEFMGTLSCQYHAKQGALSCTANTSQHDDWEFHVFGDLMTGRLTIDEGKTLYRRITLHRSETK
jgi:hypothetical protein